VTSLRPQIFAFSSEISVNNPEISVNNP
jgi:hypothetical protein